LHATFFFLHKHKHEHKHSSAYTFTHGAHWLLILNFHLQLENIKAIGVRKMTDNTFWPRSRCCQKRQLPSSFPSVRLFTCISAGPTGRIPSNLILETFTTICRENSNLVEIDGKYRTLYRKTKYVLLQSATLNLHNRALFR